MNDTTFSGNGKVSYIPVITGANPKPITNADHIAEEVADVRIMLDQVCIMFGIEFRAMRHRTEKLERLQRRLETE